MRCPLCDREVQQAFDYFVCPVHRDVTDAVHAAAAAARAEVSASSEPADLLQHQVLTRYPFPIAYGYQRVIQAENAAIARDNVIYTWTATVRFVSLVLLSEFLASPQQVPTIARVVRRLQLPSLGDWHEAFRVLALHLHATPAPGAAWPAHSAGGPLSAPLVEAARSALTFRTDDGRPILDAMVQFRNHRLGHGATSSEADLAAGLDGPRRWLDALLAALSPLVDLIPVRRVGDGDTVQLVGAARAFRSQPLTDPRLAALLDASPLALLGPSDALMPLYPLFTASEPHPEGYREPLLAFDGHVGGQRKAWYMGVDERLTRADTVEAWRGLLQAKDIDPRFTKVELSPWRLSEWARETTLARVENLRGTKYFPSAYQERRASGPDTPGLDDAVSRWLDRGAEAALILAAEAGAGKTSLLCRLSEGLLAREPSAPVIAGPDSGRDAVVMILGESFRDVAEGRLFRRIRDGLGFTDQPGLTVCSMDELLAAWRAVGVAEDVEHERRRLVVLVDAVNEAAEPSALLAEAGALAAAATAANREAGRPFVRLVLSLRAERVQTLLDRWAEHSDAPFLPHAECFAHFHDPRGRAVPYLPLRLFSADEAASAWPRAAASGSPACPAPWTELAPATRELLRHPLRMHLFHGAFADDANPPAIAAEEVLWDRWLDATFDPAHSSGWLESEALSLADACIDRGASDIPLDLAADRRERWAADRGYDPVRLAADLDPLERLAEAGLTRGTEDGGWDWRYDALAEQVFWRALRRRNPALGPEGLRGALFQPPTPRLDGALTHAATAVWRADRPGDLAVLFESSPSRGRRLLGAALARVAPRGRESDRSAELATWQLGLDAICRTVMEDPGPRATRLKNLGDALRWDLADALTDRWGATPALARVHDVALTIARKLVELAPENTGFLRDLSVSYNKIGDIDLRNDPARARAWFDQALTIARKLVELAPENTGFLRDLSVSYNKIGDIDLRNDPARARAWFDQALTIRRKLVELEPENTGFLRDLSVSYNKIGDIDLRNDPARARAWFDQALTIARKLVELEPENTGFLRDLSVSYIKLGDIDLRNDPARARAWFDQALTIARKLVELEPENTGFLRDLSASYDRMGDIDRRNDPARARAWFDQALTIARKLVELEPENTGFLRDLSVSYNKMGDIDERNDPARARAWFDQALTIRRKLVELEPENTGFLRDLSVSYNKIGDIDLRNDPARARAWFDQALTIRRKLVELEPENTGFLRDLSVSYIKLGDIDLRNDPARARAWFDQALTIARKLVELEPENTGFLRDLAASYDRMGDIDRRNDPARARAWFDQALTIARKLVELEPENREYARDVAVSLYKLWSFAAEHVPLEVPVRGDELLAWLEAPAHGFLLEEEAMRGLREHLRATHAPSF
jgi:Flp pilus assembly protein TadD